MIYPNGFIELNHLKKIVNSPQYIVYAEKNDRPDDWDWTKKGFYRGERSEIKDEKTLFEFLPKILSEEYNLCYDTTSSYYDKNPYEGQEIQYVKPRFVYKQSGDVKLEIVETKERYRDKEVVSLEVIQHDGDFNSPCFTIATWDYDSEGYEFRSIGSRLFALSENDFNKLMKAVRAGDEYLKNLFENEKD